MKVITLALFAVIAVAYVSGQSDGDLGSTTTSTTTTAPTPSTTPASIPVDSVETARCYCPLPPRVGGPPHEPLFGPWASRGRRINGRNSPQQQSTGQSSDASAPALESDSGSNTE